MSGVDTTIIIKGDTLKTQINESVLTSGDTILTEQNGIELKQVYNKETKKLTNIVRTKNVQKNISVHKTVIENISENKKENISEKKESEVINKEVERKGFNWNWLWLIVAAAVAVILWRFGLLTKK